MHVPSSYRLETRVCVCVCVCARARALVFACVFVCARAWQVSEDALGLRGGWCGSLRWTDDGRRLTPPLLTAPCHPNPSPSPYSVPSAASCPPPPPPLVRCSPAGTLPLAPPPTPVRAPPRLSVLPTRTDSPHLPQPPP